MAIQYERPNGWIRYDRAEITTELINAKAAILSLTSMPYQRSWAERLQEMQLKREVAGTSRIEGADFTERELDDAIADRLPKDQMTRSQRQARSATDAYRWISSLPSDRPIDLWLLKEIHSRIINGCDDDHCPPGQLRGSGQNVTFGRPRHRGVEGGPDTEGALSQLIAALNQEYRSHDELIQALAFHYHIGAMHPFHDGNGRTARAVEALMLQRAQLRDTLFVAMSNYYYDEKDTYLATLSEVRQKDFDLTPFIKFGLIGIHQQCSRLLREIRTHVQKTLFRDVMGEMYNRLLSTRKRALAQRQIDILNKLLEQEDVIGYRKLYALVEKSYSKLSSPFNAYVRDLNHLSGFRAITVRRTGERQSALPVEYSISVRPEWATEITETQFYKNMNNLQIAKTRIYVTE